MLWNTSSLDAAFGISTSTWIEIEEETSSMLSLSPVNDIGGEDSFWNLATAEMKDERNKKISDTYKKMTKEQWVELTEHRQVNSTQRQVYYLPDGVQ